MVSTGLALLQFRVKPTNCRTAKVKFLRTEGKSPTWPQLLALAHGEEAEHRFTASYLLVLCPPFQYKPALLRQNMTRAHHEGFVSKLNELLIVITKWLPYRWFSLFISICCLRAQQMLCSYLDILYVVRY